MTATKHVIRWSTAGTVLGVATIAAVACRVSVAVTSLRLDHLTNDRAVVALEAVELPPLA